MLRGSLHRTPGTTVYIVQIQTLLTQACEMGEPHRRVIRSVPGLLVLPKLAIQLGLQHFHLQLFVHHPQQCRMLQQLLVAIFQLPRQEHLSNQTREHLRIQTRMIFQEERVVLALGAIPTVTTKFRFQQKTYPCPDGVEIMPVLRTWELQV